MSRIPIRLRLTLVFALALAVVLAAIGAFLYVRLGASLDETINDGLAARSAELATLAGGRLTDENLRTGEPDEGFVQVVDLDGRVLAASRFVEGRSLLDAEGLARAGRSPVTVDRDRVPGLDGRGRFLARAVETPGGTRVLIVGVSLGDRDETTRGLLTELFIVEPATLVLASLLGYALARAALRPVDSMRAEAAAISASEPGRRLSLPGSQDEVRRLGETLNEMLERLERALARERTFVADASHELRTPLALLKAELELALRRPRSVEELEEALRSALAETDRLAGLADDLLLLARSDEGQLALRRSPIAPREVLVRVAERFSHRAQATNRAIEIDASESLRLNADSLQLEQALGNLLENAFRHGEGTIRLTAVENEDRIDLHVQDAGRGFPADFLPRAFDRFSRADKARSTTGAGLGLTIASLIARAHGGSAHAANLEHGGADVWLSIPRADAPVASSPARRSEQPETLSGSRPA
jgi:heavy metal sensor kinase